MLPELHFLCQLIHLLKFLFFLAQNPTNVNQYYILYIDAIHTKVEFESGVYSSSDHSHSPSSVLCRRPLEPGIRLT